MSASPRVGASAADSFLFLRGVLGFGRRGFSALLRVLGFCGRYVSAPVKVVGRAASGGQNAITAAQQGAAPDRLQLRSLRSFLPSLSALPAAGELSRCAACVCFVFISPPYLNECARAPEYAFAENESSGINSKRRAVFGQISFRGRNRNVDFKRGFLVNRGGGELFASIKKFLNRGGVPAENSLLFYAALHIFERGEHGIGISNRVVASILAVAFRLLAAR